MQVFIFVRIIFIYAAAKTIQKYIIILFFFQLFMLHFNVSGQITYLSNLFIVYLIGLLFTYAHIIILFILIFHYFFYYI